MTATVLADAAPTGAGLAIVAVILLAFFALAVGAVVLVIWLIVRRSKRNRAGGPVAPGWPAPPPSA